MAHDWEETGVRMPHVAGKMFRHGTPVVRYVRCWRCDQTGFRRPNSAVVFTWHQLPTSPLPQTAERCATT
jgi:hypothetical protein